MDDLFKSMKISSSGMKAQGTRLRVISENVANANSLPQNPNENPYRRKVVIFKNELDRAMGAETVRVKKIRPDTSDFKQKYDPSHPAADANGYVRTPNVSTLVEMTDMREAQRSYEANMNVIKASKGMLTSTIDLLR
ncbi:MAG: flagellar basal body rod protein FlgC [Rhodospirillales bacterium]|nr:flagellar basal body rod protein FlgC [Rhodospirillales bacterium]MCW8861056.1 flagellar basal body rod protein FlgC [Rhodospirillales bacterium]MCW8953056.1 flagellar basal body rod protein FlgC [Rhodospirillales bacterium]MCW8970696.1 flagellar basal body rod protein FlgC [Rhodospirillales bacterium]MCW9003479.1 flagellar basal body rod protein FlgC [Rhodospirillales bacterium]